MAQPAPKASKALRKFALIAAAVVAGVLLIAAIALYIVFLREEPRVPYEDMVTEETGIRAVFYPEHLPEAFLERVTDQHDPWLVNWVMPYEVAFLGVADLGQSNMDVRVAVDNRRLGRILPYVVNNQLDLSQGGHIEWSEEGLRRVQRGRLLLDGDMRLDPETMVQVDSRWAGVQPRMPLPMDGEHLFEFMLDNRMGMAYALAGTHMTPPDGQQDPLMQAGLESLRDLIYIHGYANFINDTDIRIDLRFECDPDGSESTPHAVQLLLGMMMAELRDDLAASYGMELDGTSELDGFTVLGEYTLTDVHRAYMN